MVTSRAVRARWPGCRSTTTRRSSRPTTSTRRSTTTRAAAPDVNRVSIGTGPAGLEGRQPAGRELPDDRLAHVQLALGRADRAPTWSRTASATSTSPSAWRTAGDVIYYEYQCSEHRRGPQGHQQGDHGHAGGHHPLPGAGQRAVPVQRQRHRRRRSDRLLRGGDADEDRLRRRQHRHHRADLRHENMHQWWGDAVSYAQPKYTFFKEGYADISEYLFLADVAGKAAGAGGLGRVQRGLRGVDRGPLRRAPPSTTRPARRSGASCRPTRRRASLFGTLEHVQPPGHVLHRAAGDPRHGQLRQGQHGDPDRRTSTARSCREQEIAVYHKYMPNQSIGCSNKLDAFFKQWWYTSYTGSPAAGNKPSITGPGPGRRRLL